MKLTYLDPEDKVIGTLVMENGKITEATGLGKAAEKLFVVEPGHPEHPLHPSDGERWLKAVRYCYRNVYVRAVLSE